MVEYFGLLSVGETAPALPNKATLVNPTFWFFVPDVANVLAFLPMMSTRDRKPSSHSSRPSNAARHSAVGGDTTVDGDQPSSPSGATGGQWTVEDIERMQRDMRRGLEDEIHVSVFGWTFYPKTTKNQGVTLFCVRPFLWKYILGIRSSGS